MYIIIVIVAFDTNFVFLFRGLMNGFLYVTFWLIVFVTFYLFLGPIKMDKKLYLLRLLLDVDTKHLQFLWPLCEWIKFNRILETSDFLYEKFNELVFFHVFYFWIFYEAFFFSFHMHQLIFMFTQLDNNHLFEHNLYFTSITQQSIDIATE